MHICLYQKQHICYVKLAKSRLANCATLQYFKKLLFAVGILRQQAKPLLTFKSIGVIILAREEQKFLFVSKNDVSVSL